MVTWPTIASIPSLGSVAYTVPVDIAATGTLTNTGSVTSATTDPGPGANSDNAVTVVGTYADLVMVKTADDAGTPAVG